MNRKEMVKMLKNLVYTGRTAGIDRDRLREFEVRILELIYGKGGDENAGRNQSR